MFCRGFVVFVGLICSSGCSTIEAEVKKEIAVSHEHTEALFDCKPKKVNFVNAYYTRF